MAFGRKRKKSRSVSRPLRVDPSATTASPGEPAFIARPDGAPVYYGFPVIEASEVDGFRFGMITDFAAQPDTCGDAFVVAPDDSRAGLVWESEVDDPYFREVLPADEQRWGVWAVGSRLPLRTEADAREFLRSALPDLRVQWEAWKVSR
jgi:hypothetical protein